MSKRLNRAWAVALTALAVVCLTCGPASADHIYQAYPLRGYIWMATSSNATIRVSSLSCNGRELDAYAAIKASAVFPNKWPNGINLVRQACNGYSDIWTDIVISYEPNSHFQRDDGTYYGGYNESFIAPAEWCALFDNRPFPCGTHSSVVHLNESRFGSGSGYSQAYQQRLIMHETGHSLGLAHHCSSDSIMNDGTSSCNGGTWTQVMSYQSTDRLGIRNVYPGWMYP